jgi:hypothetical protein
VFFAIENQEANNTNGSTAVPQPPCPGEIFAYYATILREKDEKKMKRRAFNVAFA